MKLIRRKGDNYTVTIDGKLFPIEKEVAELIHMISVERDELKMSLRNGLDMAWLDETHPT